jgi:hypothetical protein
MIKMSRVFAFLVLATFSPFSGNAQIPSYVPLSGLTGYWPFTGNANDISGNGYNGTVLNATLTTDRFNGASSAYHFAGTGKITTSYSGILGTNARAVSFWAKTNISQGVMSAVSWGSIGTATRYECAFNYWSAGVTIDGGYGVITYSPPVAAHNNQWHHYVVQMSANSLLNQVQIYQDAVLLSSALYTYNGSNTISTVSGFNVLFGQMGSSPQNAFTGDLDEIGIWNRTLTYCEIQQLYLGGGFSTTVATAPSCTGNSGGAASVTTGGAFGPYSYSWTPSVSTSTSASNLSAGGYSVTVTTAANCSTAVTFTVYGDQAPSVSVTGSGASCPGSSVVLTATGAQTYSWLSVGSGSSFTVSPLTTTNYTVTGTSALGCTNSAVYSQTVHNLPVISITSSPGISCAGSAVLLSAQGAGTYTWSSGGNGSSTTVNPIATSSYTVAGTSAQGCSNQAVYTQSVSGLPVISISASQGTSCSGSSLVLSAQGAGTYTWSSGGSGNSTTVSPFTSTAYTVTGTSAQGCTNSAVYSHVVFSVPVINILSSHGISCPGYPVVLTAQGAATYTWLPGGVGSPVIVNPAASTNFTVTGTSAQGCTSSAVYTQNVHTLPVLSIASSQGTSCPGYPAVLTAQGAVTFTWSSGGTGNSITVSPLSSTGYTVTGTSVQGCTTSAVFVQIVGPGQPLSVSGPGSVCAGSQIALAGQGSGTFTWLPGSSNGTTVLFSPQAALTVTLQGTCGNVTHAVTHQISVLASPVINLTPSKQMFCVGDQVVLTASGASSYTWQPIQSGASSVTLFPQSSITLSVSGTGTNGCVASASHSLTVRICESVREYDPVRLSVKPNPCTDFFEVEMNGKPDRLQILSYDGKMLFSENQPGTKIDVRHLPAGLYILSMESLNSVVSRRFVVER